VIESVGLLVPAQLIAPAALQCQMAVSVPSVCISDALAFAACFIFVGCVTQRTAYTLQHAHISADIGIPQSDLEQIVREVMRKTLNRVICTAQGGT